MIAVWIGLAIVVVVVLYVVIQFNAFVRLRNRIENAWAQIDVQLQRRYDLIPNFVNTVKAYATHERGVLEGVTEARSRAIGAQGVPQQAAAENMVTQALRSLFAVAEAYPELQGRRELSGPARRTGPQRGQDRLRPPVLQRHRAGL